MKATKCWNWWVCLKQKPGDVRETCWISSTCAGGSTANS